MGVQSKLEQCIEKKYSQKFCFCKMSTNNVKKTKTSEIIRIDPFKIKKETNRKKQKQKGDGLEQTVVSRLPSYRDTLTFVHLI